MEKAYLLEEAQDESVEAAAATTQRGQSADLAIQGSQRMCAGT